MPEQDQSGPLSGIRIVELAGLGPAPFAAMLLADLGADVIRVDRAGEVGPHGDAPHPDIVGRGRRSIAVDLKSGAGRQVVLDLLAGADVLIEGFRPGVTERLGIGPNDCWAVNPRLVYGRMTGWGQDGPLAATAGHDITYIAVTGALDSIRRHGQRPVPPLNLLGDLGGGSLYLVVGVLAALLEARTSGRGQVVDAAIVDGTAHLMNFILGLRGSGMWPNEPGRNLLDTGASFYDVYTCADGKEIAIGPLEPRFYAELLRLTGAEAGADSELGALDPQARSDPARWEEGKARWAEIFARRTREEWTRLLQDSDACAAPVLSLEEAPRHEQLRARGTYVEADGVIQAAPAPRFSRTPAAWPDPPVWPGRHTDELLRELGRTPEQIATARASGAVG
ncbi:CoA transferase [Jatrophihabitans telluris]|uniref:CoA transferase n=1 Tax=Jatrophihabitans telluris TaxID=2038343 RepID=A0ABY4R0P8_9ACTN|nr:CaiB/BaiF CoA-transferase family protein [Jatrophihabitans telluris]UQX89087.1 CoA transferase [Jatrophihabitans telluris]